MMEKQKDLENFKGKIEDFLSLEDCRLSPKKKKVEENKDLIKKFSDLCFDDYSGRLKSRKRYAITIVCILIFQNLAVFSFIGYLGLRKPELLTGLQIFLSVFLSGTLVETYFIFNHVVKWLFNEVDYKSFIYQPIKFKN